MPFSPQDRGCRRGGLVRRWWPGGCLVLGLAGASNGTAVGAAEGPVPIRRHYTVRRWQLEHGLPDQRVSCLLLARDGFLWAGTRQGLARFDGQHFAVWRRATHPDFSNDTCRALAEGRDGRIWVATEQGVTVVGPVQEWAVLQDGPESTTAGGAAGSASGLVAHALLVLREGGVLAGSNSGWWMDGNPAARPWPAAALEDPRVRGPAFHGWQGTDGALWVGMADQLYRLPPGGTQWEAQFPENRPEPSGVLALTGDRAGNLWAVIGPPAGRRGHLHHWRLGRWRQVLPESVYNDAAPLLLAPRHAGGVWFADSPRQLRWWHDQAQGTYSLQGLWPETDELLCLAEDADDNLWLGTARSGLFCLQRRRVEMLTPAEGLPHASARALAETADGAFWVGTDHGLARFFNGTVQSLGEAEGLQPPRVRALAEDAQGRLWVGTGGGLYRLEAGRLQAVPFAGPWYRGKIRALLPARDGAMWVGTAQGLLRLSTAGDRTWLPAQGLPHEDVRALLETRAGDLWIGTAGGGLARWRDERFECLDERHGLSSARVWALAEDEAGWIWAGTDRGLNCLHDQRLTPITLAHGLPDNQVNGLAWDGEGNLWVGHDAGIYRVPRAELVAVVLGQQARLRAVSYGVGDGLVDAETNGQTSQPSVLRRRDGRMAFATVGGVAVFDPRKLPDRVVGPVVRLTRFVAGTEVLFAGAPGERAGADRATPLRVAAHLPRVFTIEYTAPQGRAADKTRFRHRLLGASPDWVPADHQLQATYAHLRPGRYTFEVQAANAHGYWGAEPTRLHFEVLARGLERPTVRLLLGLLVVGVAGGLGWLRLRELQGRQRVALAGSRARERSRLTRDLHESLGVCLMDLTRLSHQAAQRAGPGSGPTLEELTRRSSEALNILRDLIWTNAPEQDSLRALLERLEAQTRETLALGGVHLECPPAQPPPPDRPAGPLYRRLLLLALREVVTNIRRHAAAQTVTLHVVPRGEQLEIEVRDDGIGFDPARPSHAARAEPGQGLANLRALLTELGGTVEVHSRPWAGTRVLLRVPLPRS